MFWSGRASGIRAASGAGESGVEFAQWLGDLAARYVAGFRSRTGGPHFEPRFSNQCVMADAGVLLAVTQNGLSAPTAAGHAEPGSQSSEGRQTDLSVSHP